MIDEIVIVRAGQSPTTSADWGALTWYANAGLGNSPDLTTGKCVIGPGRQNPVHSHPNCYELLTVMEGTIEHMVTGGGYTELRVGDTIAVPPGIRHNARNVGDGEAVLYLAYSSGTRQTRGE